MSLMGVLLALPPMVAHLHGGGRLEDIGRVIHQSLWVVLALGIVAALPLLNPEPFLAISRLEPGVEAKVRA
jgi:MATE family multidrug resistance protein